MWPFLCCGGPQYVLTKWRDTTAKNIRLDLRVSRNASRMPMLIIMQKDGKVKLCIFLRNTIFFLFSSTPRMLRYGIKTGSVIQACTIWRQWWGFLLLPPCFFSPFSLVDVGAQKKEVGRRVSFHYQNHKWVQPLWLSPLIFFIARFFSFQEKTGHCIQKLLRTTSTDMHTMKGTCAETFFFCNKTSTLNNGPKNGSLVVVNSAKMQKMYI